MVILISEATGDRSDVPLTEWVRRIDAFMEIVKRRPRSHWSDEASNLKNLVRDMLVVADQAMRQCDIETAYAVKRQMQGQRPKLILPPGMERTGPPAGIEEKIRGSQGSSKTIKEMLLDDGWVAGDSPEAEEMLNNA